MRSAIQMVRPLESIAETQPQAPTGFAEIVSDDFPILHLMSNSLDEFIFFVAQARQRFFRSAGRRAVSPTRDRDAARHKMARMEFCSLSPTVPRRDPSRRLVRKCEPDNSSGTLHPAHLLTAEPCGRRHGLPGLLFLFPLAPRR